jgi:hypothetical protein
LTWEPGHETEQVPELQTLPAAQIAPALTPVTQPVVAPQWLRSVRGSTQTPPQLTWEPGHETEQVPELQTLPAAQIAPALSPVTQPVVAPQWLRSVRGSTQTPPQFTCDPAHVTLHLLPLQTCPDGHLVPQAPQLLLSVVTSRQTPLQLIVEALQETLHALPLQTCPDAHLMPQPPQLALSVVMSRQTPAQLVVPVPQETLHLLVLQTCPAAHGVAQAPQLALSVVVSRQTPPQLVVPAPHVTEHLLPLQS